MVERAQSERQERCDDVGCDIKRIELPAIRKQALQHFRTQSKSECDDNESEVKNPAPRRIEDPIEGCRQYEEGEEMQDLWVDLRDLGGTET